MKSALRPTSSASPRLCASHSLASPSPSRSSRLLLSPFGLNPGRMAAKITERRKRTRFPSDETAFLQRSHTRQTPPRDRHGMRCLRPKRPPARIPTADTTEPRRKENEPAPFVAPPRKSASNVNSMGLTPLLSPRRETTVQPTRFGALLGSPTTCQMDRSDPIAPFPFATSCVPCGKAPFMSSAAIIAKRRRI